MKNFTIFISVFLIIININGQAVAWQTDIPSSTQDFLTQVCITMDRQYLVSGSAIQLSKISSVSTDEVSKNSGYDYRIMKLNQQGNPIWEKYFSGGRHDYLASTVSTQEGGFILAGTSWSSAGGNKREESFGGSDLWIIKIDENGDEEWQKTIGTQQNEEAKSIVQTTDLSYFVAGDISSSKEGFGGKDAFLVKLDPQGKIISKTIIGGSGLEEVEKLIPTRDGGALLGIYSRSDLFSLKKQPASQNNSNLFFSKSISKSVENYGAGDFWVIKIDRNAQLQWQKNFGGNDDDRIKTMTFFDNGYLIGGESRSFSTGNKQIKIKEGADLWFIALNENGDELWQKSYSFGNRDILMSQNTISGASGTRTKGFLIGGYTQAEEKMEKNDETFWMLYLDNKGDEVWRKYIEGKSRQNEERLVDAGLQSDGSYILAGTSALELGKENWKIVKLGSEELENLLEKQDIRIYPNPVDDYCYVEIGFDFREAEIALYDFSGKLVKKIKTQNNVTKMNTANLPQGVYVVTATTEKKNFNNKFVKK